jgi:hypothetical protein
VQAPLVNNDTLGLQIVPVIIRGCWPDPPEQSRKGRRAYFALNKSRSMARSGAFELTDVAGQPMAGSSNHSWSVRL